MSEQNLFGSLFRPITRTNDYTVPLRPGVSVEIFGVPEDLTLAEVERLTAFLQSLCVPDKCAEAMK